jgi:hypothetical protein
VSEAGDARASAFVAGCLIDALEAIGRITGEVGAMAASTINVTQNNVAIVNSPQFAMLQATILRALGPFPDARAAVAQALREIDASAQPSASLSANGGDSTKVIEHAV